MRTIIVLIAFLFYACLVYPVFAADVVINEVFANPSGSSAEETEFIEFFNKGSESVDISGWKISDKVKTYIIVDTIIPASGFVAFRKSISGIQLNNSDEEVTLKDLSDQVIDLMSYDTAIEDKSWSRVPDGTGSFINNIDPTEGIANSVPTPTPSPAPTPTSTPANTPTPTSAPTPTKTPIPTQASHTPTPKLSISPTSKILPTDVLGESTKADLDISPTESETASDNVLVASESKKSGNLFQKILIFLGVVFIASCVIVTFYKVRKENMLKNE